MQLKSLLSRVFNTFNTSQKTILSENQKSKLQSSLTLTSKEADCLIQTLIEIILQVKYFYHTVYL